MEMASAGYPSILTDSRSFNNLNQVYRAASAHKDMFHTKLPAVERNFIKYSVFRTLTVLVGNVFQVVFCVNMPCVPHAFKDICVSYQSYHSK